MFRAGLYARVYERPADAGDAEPGDAGVCRPAGWTITAQVREIGSGAAKRRAREKWLEAARRREVDRRKNGFFCDHENMG